MHSRQRVSPWWIALRLLRGHEDLRLPQVRTVSIGRLIEGHEPLW